MRNAATTGKRVGYGWLYNWFAVADARGLAPNEWDIPTDAEWTELTDYLTAEYGHITSSNVGGALKSTRMEWESPNSEATNEFGFETLPSGYRLTSGSCDYVGRGGYWWSSSERSATSAWYRGISTYGGNVFRNYFSKRLGYSVRCIQPRAMLSTYGRLYTWSVIQDSRGITPPGYRVPTAWGDWQALWSYINDTYNIGDNEFGVGNHLKSRRQDGSPLGEPWDTNIHPYWAANENEWGRDTVNFNALPLGLRVPSNGNFLYFTTQGRFWTASEHGSNSDNAIRADMSNGSGNLSIGNSSSKNHGYPFRFMRDATTEEKEYYRDGEIVESFQDNNENLYHCRRIGDQVWMDSNFAGTKYNNGDDIEEVQGNEDWADLDIDDKAYCDYNGDPSYSITPEPDGTTGILTDIEDNIYKWVVIGGYRWMAENLRTTKYKNGDLIPEITDPTTWSTLETGARCAFNNDHYLVYPPKR